MNSLTQHMTIFAIATLTMGVGQNDHCAIDKIVN